MGDTHAGPDLYQALIQARESAAENTDHEAERAATLRLSDVLNGA